MTEEEKEGLSFWESAGFFLTHWTALKAIITAVMLFLGYGTATNENVQAYFKSDVEIPEGELVDLEEQDLTAAAIKALNEKVKKHDAALESLNHARRKGDSNLEQRVLKLEQHH